MADEKILPVAPGLPSVMAAAIDAVGLGGGAREADRLALGLPTARRACVVLVDGLGIRQLRERRGHAPTMRGLGLDREITSVVPSTTAAGITAVGTGEMPGQTAMIGYALKNPNDGSVFNLIAWNGEGVSADTWQTVPTLAESLGDPARLAIIQPRKFVGSGLTNAALRGAKAVVAETLEARVDAAARELRGETEVVYLYWGDIDKTGHQYGWQSENWISELEAFDAQFHRLLRTLPKGTLVVLTADHGMIDVEERLDIARIETLTRGVDVVAGESRAVHLYTAEPDAVADRWRAELGERAWVYTATEAIEAGMFGPTTQHTRSVMGDVLAFARNRLAIVDSRYQSDGAIGLIGVHGSLTPDEMYVPLIVEVC